MPDNKQLVIIGPSKSGKTALVASLYHAATTLTQSMNDDYSIEVIPKNQMTVDLFQNITKLLQTGDISSAITATNKTKDYHIEMRAPDPSPTFFERITDWFGDDEDDICDIHFPDSPGGAIFRMMDEEVDDVGLDMERDKLVQRLSKAYGLIVCLDSAILSPNESSSAQRELALNFARWLPGLFARIVETQGESSHGKLNLRKVCFVMTKADLWAKENDLSQRAEISVQNRDAYDHAVDILGKVFFIGLRQHFSDDTEFSFFMSSVYGFKEGGIQEQFFEYTEDNEVMMLDEWRPFNVIEPFLAAVDATPPGTFVTTKSKQELGK